MRRIGLVLALVCLLAVSATAANAGNGGNGNGAPSGSHYNLNLIGVPQDKSASLTDSQRHTIFVPLEGKCQISLVVGDFQVNDGNCTDGPAEFQLPNPDPANTGTTTYSVFAQALGTPGGSANANTCATDPTDGSLVCSVLTLTLTRNAGQTQFQNVSKYLLYIYTADGQRVPLFDSSLQDYFWSYDNNGLKLAQLRFYPCATIVPAAGDPNGNQLDLNCF